MMTYETFISLLSAPVPSGSDAQLLMQLHQARHSFRCLRQISGLTQFEFSQRYGIPRRSVENWDAGFRSPPSYLLDLLCFAIYQDTKEG